MEMKWRRIVSMCIELRGEAGRRERVAAWLLIYYDGCVV